MNQLKKQNAPDSHFSGLLEESCKAENDIHTSTGSCFLTVFAKYASCGEKYETF
jgi:hypothetical protein